MRTPEDTDPQPDTLPPSERMDPDVPRDHRYVEVVPPLRLDVHVSTEDLKQ